MAGKATETLDAEIREKVQDYLSVVERAVVYGLPEEHNEIDGFLAWLNNSYVPHNGEAARRFHFALYDCDKAWDLVERFEERFDETFLHSDEECS